MTNFTVPGYILQDKIGEGSMSEVYRAFREDHPDRIVAIKILRHYLKEEKDYNTRMKKEASLLEGLSDDRIVKIFDVVRTSDSRIALVQEFVSGKNVEKLFSGINNTPAPNTGAVIISEILLGLEESHRQGIIHRDLKPENIIITRYGKVKITDFGVAKNLESEDLTMTGIIMGSPAYMSPEQAKGLSVDNRSDIFSLGVLLYLFATGKLPFKGKNYSSVANSICNEVPKSVEKVNQKVHPELSKIIARALEKDPEKRYRNVYEFRYELQIYLDLISAQSPYKVLQAFFEGDLTGEKTSEERLISTIMMRAENAFKIGDKRAGLNLTQQLLSLDPQNEKAKTLITQTKYIKRRGKAYMYLAVTFICLMSGIYFAESFYKKDKALEVVKISKKALVKKIVKDKIVIKKSAIKKVPRKVVKKKVLTKVFFNVDDDVAVFLDGLEIKNPRAGAVAATPGTHNIQLVKKGFAPIQTTINVLKGKVTTINARNNGGRK